MDKISTDKRLATLGQTIREQRVKKKISQQGLAHMINTGQSYIYRLESGKINITIEKLIKIAEVLEVSVKDLIEF